MRQFFFSVIILMVHFTAFAGEDPKISLEFLKKSANKYGLPKVEGTDKAGDRTVPALYFGKRKMNNYHNVVDNVKKTHGGTATLFVKDGDEYVRITTNVLKDDGTRGVGTTLAHNKAYDAIRKGETFCGEVDILGSPYNTCYEPIKDASGLTIGIYYVGYKKQ